MHVEPRLPVCSPAVEVELRDAARLRVVEASADRPVELAPEAPADRVDARDIAPSAAPRPEARRSIDAPERDQAAEKAASVARHDVELARGRDQADELVPFEIQRAGVIGLELELAAIEQRISPVMRSPLASVTTSVFGCANAKVASGPSAMSETPAHHCATRQRAGP